MQRKPEWLRKELFNRGKDNSVRTLIRENKINTVCSEASCPNIGECFSRNVATFLLLGNICTRNCRFCNILNNEEKPLELDADEPKRVADAVKKLGLKYVVLTSVTRDDLDDGGASIFVETAERIKEVDNNILVEVLVPDFNFDTDAIDMVLSSPISLFNHNLETVKSIYKSLRPKSNYERSLKVLEYAKKNSAIPVKTGIMVGLGETEEEVIALFEDFKNIGGDILTIGHYLPPSKKHYDVVYQDEEVFEKYRDLANNIGIKTVISGPFIRSSYYAEESFFSNLV